MSSASLKKENLNELSIIFKEKILLNSYRVEDLKKYSIEAKLSKERLRPIAWKIFLGVLPNTTSLREWVEIISNQREEFKKKIKKYCKIKKFVGDPLGGGKKKKKVEEPVEDTDLKNLINKDLERTHQEMDLFLQNKIKNILANVLYIWSKENSEVSYRQGMNELLAIIFIVFYPFYFTSSRKPKNTKENILDFLKDISLYKDDIYIYFHDEDEIQSDLFFTFEALMKKGMTNLFDPHILQKDEPGYKLYEIFPQMWKDDSNENKPTYVYRRSTLIIKEKLKSLDNSLYSHFKKIDLNCEVFLQRYLRCIFCREFNLKDVYIIWDIIFYDYYVNRKKEKYDFIYMDYICIAMIFKIRDALKDADQNECFSTLFKYPQIKDINDILKLAKKVEQAINERLNGKNSNVYDILGIMKPIESEPSHLFSPHMYNQSNKTSTNSSSNNNSNTNTSNSNTIKSYNRIENNYNYNQSNQNNTYDNFEEDEKDNINLDSVNHNNSNNNDLSSQAKSFFNNALNSLTNFGGIIKDQLQNAKDTVMDSLKGSDSNSNYKTNNYKEFQDEEQDNYNNNYSNNYSNNYNSDNNYNKNNNYNNNDTNNNDNENQNENEQQNDNGEMRKASFDSQNELGYNRQDIIDIVGKLKEIDTKYNMFFNDEDKRNLRIIIDYLKKKI
jgi:TBC1 domain family protein 5